jgi:hypothetical protein
VEVIQHEGQEAHDHPDLWRLIGIATYPRGEGRYAGENNKEAYPLHRVFLLMGKIMI